MEHPSTSKQEGEVDEVVKIMVKWNNLIYHLEMDSLDDVAILKHVIYRETLVRPDRQKILNLKGKGGELI